MAAATDAASCPNATDAADGPNGSTVSAPYSE